MRRLIVPIGTALLIAGCSTGGHAASTPPTTVPVLKVTDGDTIHVMFEGQDERVRLIGIDTPEVPWYGGHEECFGVAAGLYARERLDGRRVRLEFDVEQRDRYDRLLAYVYLGTELFNLTLVQQGYATADPIRPDTKRAELFAGAEADAHSAGRGLWSACSIEKASGA